MGLQGRKVLSVAGGSVARDLMVLTDPTGRQGCLILGPWEGTKLRTRCCYRCPVGPHLLHLRSTKA